MQPTTTSNPQLAFRIFLSSLLVVIVGAVGGCQAAVFMCASDADCDAGQCEPAGYCSFSDDGCPSGRRYGTAAGNGLGSRCVPEEQDDPATEGSTSVATTTSSGPGSDTGMPDNTATQTETSDGALEPDTTEGGPASTGTESTGTESSGESECGNGVVEAGEACDFGTLDGATCVTQGMSGGELGCLPDCTFDTSDCEFCGNGVVEVGEVCDGSISGVGCTDLAFVASGSATISCSDACDQIVVEGCGEFICDADPLLAFGDCPAQCTMCYPDGTCQFECTTANSCADQDVVCPAGRDCSVLCNGTASCSRLSVRGDDLYRTDVTCIGSGACDDVAVDCAGGVGQCFLDCLDQPAGVCPGAHLTCGADDCGIKCTDAALVGATVDCGSACGCAMCGPG